MREYTIHFKNSLIGKFTGENLIEAIEQNFQIIVKNRIGNAAGYKLERVWMEYNSGDDVAELHVISTGSDALIGYDPIKDQPKEVVFQVSGVGKTELPSIVEVELNKPEQFDPFDEKWIENKAAAFGILKSTINYISQHYCQFKKSTNSLDGVCDSVDFAYPTLATSNTQAYINQLFTRLNHLRPLSNKKAQKYIDLAHKMQESLIHVTRLTISEEGSSRLYFHKTNHALECMDKITALLYYRKIAGKTQQEVADEVGISLRQYQRYECINSSLGDTKLYVIEKIASVLGVSVNEIFDGNFVVLIDNNEK